MNEITKSGGELAPPSIETIIQSAVQSGRPASELKELLDFARQLDADKARKAFNAAFAAFKAECPAIQRKHDSQFKTVDRNGVQRVRKFADLEDIARAVDPVLAKHGLSYSWGETKVEAGLMSVPCIVAHDGGHSISGSFPVPVDSKAGCSDAQKYGIAHTYARRYSLVSVLGLTSVDEDNDGADENGRASGEKISPEQYGDLTELLSELPVTELPKFLAYMRVKALGDIPASEFKRAIDALNRKVASQK